MKIRVLSDLHLECDEPEVIAHADADLIVLAGDIHNHAAGLYWAAETFDPTTPIVYVPGNHEYYDGEFGALEVAMRDAAAAIDNVHYLNNASFVDPRGQWRVLGTTLWTDFELFGADDASRATAMAASEKSLVDYRGPIQLAWTTDAGANESASHNFTPVDSLALHRQARAWLAAEIAKPFAGKTIVVTHHAPHRDSLAPRFAHDLASAGFISHLPTLVREPVALWIHGHTHASFDYVVNGTRVVCNPRGYVDRRRARPENPAFSWDKVVDL
ncbi:MAG TPA: metallophosphoesterase [Trinickia sp.]|uniref:metallophosphoesterase n=1 Tax=Trinickia sp. TaxID=2571163 RepID=UPI002B6BA9FA|nr:metallophosphoesterase [Trinickia sp.]HTI17282.1 metallophosphoesterase [Trinickia sp.]